MNIFEKLKSRKVKTRSGVGRLYLILVSRALCCLLDSLMATSLRFTFAEGGLQEGNHGAAAAVPRRELFALLWCQLCQSETLR